MTDTEAAREAAGEARVFAGHAGGEPVAEEGVEPFARGDAARAAIETDPQAVEPSLSAWSGKVTRSLSLSAGVHSAL